jgi:hypothetical protein
MAYTIANGSHLSVTFRGQMYLQEVMNTFHYRYDGPVIPDGLVFLNNLIGVNAQMQALSNLHADCLSEDVIGRQFIAQWIAPLRFRSIFRAMPSAVGNAGPAMTPNIASVVTLVADRGNRHGIGNKHLPGVAVDRGVNGILTAPQLAAMSAFGIAAATSIPILGGVLQPVIYNRKAPETSLDATGQIINDLVRVQRRRTVGLGK